MAHKRRKLYKSGSKIVENSFLRDLTKEQLEQKIKEEAYLGILTNDSTLANPLLEIPMIAHDNFSEYLVYLMSRPEYFYFIIRTLFGMKTFPMQVMMLKEMYEHRFPIIIGARGAAKCVAPDTLVISNTGIKRIKELVPLDIEGEQPVDGSLLGENKYTEIKNSFYNGEKPTKIIKSRSGRQIEATYNHPIRVVSNGEIIWKNSEDISVGDFLPIVRGSKQWNYKSLDKDIAYTLGALIGDGCYTRKAGAIGFTNKDSECIDAVRAGLLKWKNDLTLRKTLAKTRKQITYICSGGKSVKNEFIKTFGLQEYDGYGDKSTPECIFSASHESIAAYLSGLFDTDGTCITKSPVVEFSSKSELLIKETQFLLMCLGINSNIKISFNKKYKRNYYKLKISGNSINRFKETVGFRISRKNTLLAKHCSKTTNDNIDLLPKELILEKMLALRELARDTSFHKLDKKTQKLISPNRLKKYSLSYKSFGVALDTLAKSELVKSSKEYSDLVEIYRSNHYYDQVVSIEDGFCKTYDVELVNDHSFVSNGFISHNTTGLGLYAFIRMITTPGVKIVITGAGFRQAKLVFEVMERIWEKAPMLRNCFKGAKNGPNHGTDAWTFRLGESICYALPIGHDGSKVRGFRANCLIADEFASMPRVIFEEVMSGFLSVSADSIGQIQQNAFINAKKKLGLPLYIDDKDDSIIQNQLILSGTAYYRHNHFYEYFSKWKKIIESRGDIKLVKEFFKEDEDFSFFNWKDYSIFRVPVELVQSGHMDMAQISRIKTSSNRDVYLREYSACFSDDSDGFFKRSLIQSCSLSKENQITKGGEEIKFSPAIYGRQSKKHIFGVDPAYQGDNFAIVILEVNNTHRRVVHCWTTQASDHKQRLKDKIITENNYYKYCVRKIRDLMKRFPCAYIALDKGGGGDAIKEAFTETAGLLPGEEAIYPIIDPTEKPQDTDFMQGEHILHIIKFSSDWVTQANHALKKDMETRDIIFPYHDDVSYVEAEFYDQSLGEAGQLYDTLEDCMSEIEELKNELSTIAISETASGKEHFDTPDKKTAGMKKGRLRKDRYSALLMANMVARDAENLVVRQFATTENIMDGYFSKQKENTAFLGNGPIADKLNALYCD